MNPGVRQLLLGSRRASDDTTTKGLIIWGDSTAAQCDVYAPGTQTTNLGNNWAAAGLHIAGHPLTITYVGGNSGQRTDQIIPTFAAQVAVKTGAYVLMPVATNDLIQGVAATTIIGYLTTMASLVRSVGKLPVLMTVSCGDTISASAPIRTEWLAYNASVRTLATTLGVPCIDIEQAYIDPATIGTTYAPLAGYTDGGVHPQNRGAIEWGRKFAIWLATLATRDLRATTNNEFGNPLFTGTGGSLNGGATGTAPTGGTAVNFGGTTASSIVARSDGRAGNWWQVASSGTTSADSIYLILGTVGKFAAGERFRGMCDVEVDSGFVNMLYMDLRFQFNGATMNFVNAFTPAQALGAMLSPYPKMQFRVPEIVVPAGTTSITPYLFLSCKDNAPWSFTARVGGVYAGRVR